MERDDLITTPEAAEILGVTRETLRIWVMQGKRPLPVKKLRGSRGVRLYSRLEVEAVAHAGGTGTDGSTRNHGG